MSLRNISLWLSPDRGVVLCKLCWWSAFHRESGKALTISCPCPTNSPRGGCHCAILTLTEGRYAECVLRKKEYRVGEHLASRGHIGYAHWSLEGSSSRCYVPYFGLVTFKSWWMHWKSDLTRTCTKYELGAAFQRQSFKTQPRITAEMRSNTRDRELCQCMRGSKGCQ